MTKSKIAYFGGEPIGLPVLKQLCEAGYKPDLVITNPDRPQGRKMTLTPPPIKEWALLNDIEVFQPENLKNKSDLKPITEGDWDLFIVVAYSNLIPKWILELPKHKTINLHPSLLPKYRGPSPIRSMILADDKDVGVSIIELDEKMDHGSIIAQEKLDLTEIDWPIGGTDLDSRLATLGSQLLTNTLPLWLSNQITPQTQDHTKATFTQKISKADGELKLNPHQLPQGEEAYQTLLKIRAFDGWPGTFFFHQGKRIKIVEANIDKSGQLNIEKIIPEGKNQQDFKTWLENQSA